jgi:hypothetical protein
VRTTIKDKSKNQKKGRKTSYPKPAKALWMTLPRVLLRGNKLTFRYEEVKVRFALAASVSASCLCVVGHSILLAALAFNDHDAPEAAGSPAERSRNQNKLKRHHPLG